MPDLTSLATVRGDGCILLGDYVSCDGCDPTRPIRIQTHVHTDHLKDFPRSKGHQKKIVLSQATYELLIAELNAELLYRRSQFVALPSDGTYHNVEGVEIGLFPSSHMLGSVMPVIRNADGISVMYAADFSYPTVFQLPKVDVLVIDATYGNPSAQRDYQEEEVIQKFIEIFDEQWDKASVIISGYRGRLQFAIQLLADRVNAPFLVGKRTANTISVFMKHLGFTADVHQIGSATAREILKSGKRFVAFLEPHERKEHLGLEGNRIILSAFMVPHEDPILVRSDNSIRIALTDHADFAGTISLIREVSPQLVIADSSRGGDADALAEYVKRELGIEAISNVRPVGNYWGGIEE